MLVQSAMGVGADLQWPSNLGFLLLEVIQAFFLDGCNAVLFPLLYIIDVLRGCDLLCNLCLLFYMYAFSYAFSFHIPS